MVLNALTLILCLAGLYIYTGSHRTDDAVVAWIRFIVGILIFGMGVGAWLIKWWVS